jgi:hypothetical protein
MCSFFAILHILTPVCPFGISIANKSMLLPNALLKFAVISHFMVPEALHCAEHDTSFLESKTSFGAAKLTGKFNGHS